MFLRIMELTYIQEEEIYDKREGMDIYVFKKEFKIFCIYEIMDNLAEKLL